MSRVKQMLDNMGVRTLSTGSQVIPESATGSNLYQRIEALKKGAYRNQVTDVVNGLEGNKKNSKHSSSFAPIPESNGRNRGNRGQRGQRGPQVAPEHVQQVQSFAPEGGMGSEEAAIMRMAAGLDGGGGGSATIQQHDGGITDVNIGSPYDTDNQYNMPEFNPHAMTQNKYGSPQGLTAANPQISTYEKFQQQRGGNVEMQNDMQLQENPQLNQYHLQKMIQEISKNMIEKVLSEYIQEKNTPKNMFERVKNHDDVIKIDGEYFRLQPVKVRKKTTRTSKGSRR